ncbi:L-aspartate oxidase [Sediminibacillus massiliensis]|uniref:L-aspartate oxidase n=1 Tax=Sediminibacillus massiliensis TaxID=1926277 RepID=UPI0009888202|nr:L-aspartate oxidase [Sediminibacillus massiliensis]
MDRDSVLIIGSGIAALTAASRLIADKNVIIFTKGSVRSSNSYLAQGGVAVAITEEDHWENHSDDTLAAGCFHNHAGNVRELVRKGPLYIKNLIGRGMEFDRNAQGEFDLGKEGAHLVRRILHAEGDSTGRVLVDFMLEQIKGKVKIVENEMAMELLLKDGRCVGVLTKKENGKTVRHFANATIIATGGCGGIYSLTSNDPTITGDGLAMAYRAGAELTDMEFIQFHPTMLHKNGRVLGLVSEAVRGEGAVLVDNHRERIMKNVHPLEDLAPRDIVTRKVYQVMKQGRQVYLDISSVENFEKRFPAVYNSCLVNDIDLKTKLIPVVPGSHFSMGGIKASLEGETTVPGLFAVGEASCTGVHGANRIASNSLLEGIVCGNAVADKIISMPSIPCQYGYKDEERVLGDSMMPEKQQIKDYMMEYVGVIRQEDSLVEMKEWLEGYDFFHIDPEKQSLGQVETANMLLVSWLITTSALKRKESRGSHFRADYPAVTVDWNQKRVARHIAERKVTV